MKISLISTTTFPTPPSAYGGEIFVHWLCEELCNQGHEVILFATYDSVPPTNGKLIPLRKTPQGDWIHMLDAEHDIIKYHTDILKCCDVVHDFSHNGQIAKWCGENNIPHCNTLWGISYIGNSLQGSFARSNVVCWSEIHKSMGLIPEENWINNTYSQWHPFSGTIRPSTKVVMGGVNTKCYPMGLPSEKEDWLLFLGRAHPSKGLDIVIEIAKRNPDIKIKMAGSFSGLHKQDGDMYKSMVNNLDNVKIIENVGIPEKRELFKRCKAFLFPVQYCEAFGLVVTEAMAAGVPAIVSNKGSMTELVENGVTGFICNDIEHYENAIRSIDYINKEKVAKVCKEKFGIERVAKDYIKVYKKTISGEIW